MIPLLKDAVLGHNWLSEEMFYDFIGVTESTPGPIGEYGNLRRIHPSGNPGSVAFHVWRCSPKLHHHSFVVFLLYLTIWLVTIVFIGSLTRIHDFLVLIDTF
jgi:hypothetical protein